MYLTARDREILRFIEEYESITITQCSKLFFKGNKHAYYQARIRLKKLSDNKHIKRYRKDMRSEVVYYNDKKLSVHDLKILDIYAWLVEIGASIKCFEKSHYIGKDYIVDALFEFEYNGYFYPLILEVDHTHLTGNKKLLDIYNSNHFQERYKHLDDNIFPTVLVLRHVIPSAINEFPFDIIYTDFELSDVEQVLL